MKCSNCGYESERDFEYCANCGCSTSFMASVGAESAGGNKLMSALKDKMFLAICILITASVVFSLAMGTIPLFYLLYTIFLWQLYSSALKDGVTHNHMRRVSGTVFATYVTNYILCGLLVLLGMMFAVLLAVAPKIPVIKEYLDSAMSSINISGDLLSILVAGSGIIIAVVFVIVAVLEFLYNFFIIRVIHRFAKSVSDSVQEQSENYESANTASSLLVVLAVLSAITAIRGIAGGELLSAFNNGSIAAATILGSILIKKYKF